MPSFTELISASAINRANDEDLCSQINYVWTSLVISAMALMITMVQYVGDPIHCLCPAQLTEAQCNYTKALCWVKHNYFVHEDSVISYSVDERYDLTVAYYPWVPWVLFAMAVGLNIPSIMWKIFAPASGLELKKFIAKADAHETLENLGQMLVLWLGHRKPRKQDEGVIGKVQRTVGSCGLFWCGRHQRSYLCGLLLLTKLGYLLVTVAEFIILNVVFIVDEDAIIYGWGVVHDFLHGATYELSRFPVYTLCDIKIRQLSNIQRYTFQCVLPLNMYNQKIFLVLWFWLLIISLVNAYSFTRWALFLLSYSNRRHFIKNYVILHHHLLEKKPRARCASGGTPSSASAVDGGDDERGMNNEPTHSTGTGLSYVTCASTPSGAAAIVSPRRRVRVNLPSEIEECVDPVTVPMPLKDAKRKISLITKKMMRELGHDGVTVFRLLENAVGVVISNRIFQELYEQLDSNVHFS